MTRSDYKDQEMKGVEELRHRLKGAMSQEMYADTDMFIRFLRARNHDVTAAEIMLRNHTNWRKTNRVDTLLQTYTPHEVARKYIPFTKLGFDHEGSPIMYCAFGNMDTRGVLKSIKVTEYTNFIVHMLEGEVQLLKQQSKKLNRKIDKWVHIFNFENFPLSIATHKPSLEAIGKLVSMYEGHYPERLKLAIVINASWYFQIAFALVKPLITGPTLDKIKIYGKDGWQEELKKLMNNDELPACFGGNRTDPDGDVMCRSYINHGGPVPESFYAENSRVNLATQPGVRKLTINRLSKVQVELKVLHPGSEIEWEFETKGKDIAFALLYKESKKSDEEAKELLPKQRVDTSISSESGVFKSEKAGIYYLEFDNTYSWIHQKDVYYKIKITNDHIQRNGA